MTSRTELEWQDDALCAQVGMEIFFPTGEESTEPAKKICAKCDVAEVCAEYAIRTVQTHGIWGVLTAKQLSRRRAALRKAAKVA